MKVAYLVNHYPKVSHTFIRREILALEKQGVEVQRIAIRGWDNPTPDAQDASEGAKTAYVLQKGFASLVVSGITVALTNTARFVAALRLAIEMSRRSDRSLPYHVVYLLEACRVLELTRGSGAQHLHAHFGTNSAEVATLTYVLGGPGYSFTVHGPEEFDKPEALHLAKKIELSRFVVAITSFCRSQLFRWATYEHWSKVKEVHCGIDADFYSGDLKAPGGCRLVCVGRLSEQKGHLLLIEAAAAAKQAGAHFELVLAGDGELRSVIESRVKELNLTENVRITGWIDSSQVKQELLNARALVMASFAEGLPVVLMEAMCLARPVLTTSVAGVPELVVHGVNGWLYPAGNVEAMAAAMVECINTPDAVLEGMGAAGRIAAIAAHSADGEAAKLKKYFQEAIDA